MALKWDEACDTVVLGTGIAGLSTALAATRRGLRTVVLETAAQVGGGTSHSAGLIWVGQNHLAKAAGVDDPREQVLDYMTFLAGGQALRENMATFIDYSPGALRFFERCGIPFRLVKGVPDHYFGMAPGALAFGRSVEAALISGHTLGKWCNRVERPKNAPYFMTAEEQVAWGGFTKISEWDRDLVRKRQQNDDRGVGVGLVTHFLGRLLAEGVAPRVRQNVTELVVERDRVAGVRLSTGKTIRAHAGVAIATGGYDSNPKLMNDFEGLPGVHSMFPASLRGDGLILGSRAGGAVHVVQNHMQLFLGFPVPVGDSGRETEFRLAGIMEACSPHTLVVNRAGERFGDESYFQHLAPKLREFSVERHDYPNLPCFLVFDQSFADAYSFAGRAAGAPIPRWVKRADDVEALAKMLQVEPQGLSRTVSRFNGFVRQGRDEDFGRGEAKWTLAKEKRDGAPRSLGTLAKPPYYGIELRPSVASSAGLLTDAGARVMRYDRRPIRGLYAIGNAAAHTEFGAGYQAGYTMTSGMTFGLLASTHMRRALRKA